MICLHVFYLHTLPCISFLFVFCHSVSSTLASSLSLCLRSSHSSFHSLFLCFALRCSLMRKWLVLGECFLALRRDNKPICYLPQWPLQQPTSANSQRPSQGKKTFPIKSVAVPSKWWDEAHTRQHSATFAVRRLCTREQRIVMKSHKYFSSISDGGKIIFFLITEIYFYSLQGAAVWLQCTCVLQKKNFKLTVK